MSALRSRARAPQFPPLSPLCSVGATFKLTSQAVPAQVDPSHAVAELADVRRQLEAGVALQLNRAVLDKLPAQKLERDGSCARNRISTVLSLSPLCSVGAYTNVPWSLL